MSQQIQMFATEDENKAPLTEAEFEVMLEELCKQFDDRAKLMSVQKKKDISYEVFVERVNKIPTGNVYVAYLAKPNFLSLAKAMDYYIAGKYFEAGALLYGIVVQPESDPEIESNDAMKVGLMGKIGASLDIQAPEIKKK